MFKIRIASSKSGQNVPNQDRLFQFRTDVLKQVGCSIGGESIDSNYLIELLRKQFSFEKETPFKKKHFLKKKHLLKKKLFLKKKHILKTKHILKKKHLMKKKHFLKKKHIKKEAIEKETVFE